MTQPAWLRGPVQGIPTLLQPVAHALIDADEDVQKFVPSLSAEQIALRPAGVASVAYHVTHAIGSLDRLFTYARGEALDAGQLAVLAAEKMFDAGGATDRSSQPSSRRQSPARKRSSARRRNRNCS